MSAINNRRAQHDADAEFARREAYNEAMAAENPLARADSQLALNEYNRRAREQMDIARSRNRIIGGTPEQELLGQRAMAEGYASLLGGIGAQASGRADTYRAQAEQARIDRAADQQMRSAARNDTYAALAGNAANAMSGLWAPVQEPDIDFAAEIQRLTDNYNAGTSGMDEVTYNNTINQLRKMQANSYVANLGVRKR